MSYLDDASIVFIPSGLKEGAMYAQKPIPYIVDSTGNYDGTDPDIWNAEMPFIRPSTASYVNSEGLVVPNGAAINVPRIDYTNGVPQLLTEGQSTNYLYYSSDYTSAWWQKPFAGTGRGPTVMSELGVSPSGDTDAQRVYFNKGAGTTAGDYSYLAQSGASGGSAVVSVYLKSYTGQNYTMQLKAGFNGSKTITVTDQWQRFYVEDPNKSCTFLLGLWGDLGNDDIADVLMWGAQGELQPYYTSYIPTTSARVTRSPDGLSKTSISNYLGQTEGTIFIDFVYYKVTGGSAYVNVNLVNLNAGTYSYQTDNAARIYYGSGVVLFEVRSAASTTGYIVGPTLENGQRYRVAASYKANDFKLYVNGVLAGTDTSGAVPVSLSSIFISENGGTPSSVLTNQALIFPTALSSDELASLTTL